MTLNRPRLRLKPQLSSIQLDDVLSGETCEPISLADFESYLMHKEHSVENLRFVVWYQSYRCRFFALPLSQQALSPGPRGFNFALPTPARTAQRISRTSTHATTLGSEPDEPTSPTSLLNPPLTPTSISPLLSRIPSVPLPASSSPPPRPQAQRVPAPAEMQPFRHECTLVESTFLLPSAPYELSLPSLLLSTILRDLTINTHPDVFLPAYEFAYDALLTHSLPCFLDGMHENMNWEKKMYWWLYGALTSVIGWAICIGCLFIEYSPNTTQGKLRAWRLLGVPFLSLGAMQMYSAYRGFCSQIWGRGAMQLRPWELASLPFSSEEVSAAPPASSDRKLRRISVSTSTSVPQRNFELSEVSERPLEPQSPVMSGTDSEAKDSKTADISIEVRHVDEPSSSPSSSRRRPSGLTPIITDGYRDVWDDVPSPLPHSVHPPVSSLPVSSNPQTYAERGRRLRRYTSMFSVLSNKTTRDAPYTVSPRSPMLSTRAKVFGPERVVLDPRIRAVHRRVMRDIVMVGFVVGTLLTVVVVSLPHGR